MARLVADGSQAAFIGRRQQGPKAVIARPQPLFFGFRQAGRVEIFLRQAPQVRTGRLLELLQHFEEAINRKILDPGQRFQPAGDFIARGVGNYLESKGGGGFA